MLIIPKNFPLSKFICQGKNVRRWLVPYGTRMGRINISLGHICACPQISPTRIYLKLDYILSLLPQAACLGKFFEPRYFGPKLA